MACVTVTASGDIRSAGRSVGDPQRPVMESNDLCESDETFGGKSCLFSCQRCFFVSLCAAREGRFL